MAESTFAPGESWRSLTQDNWRRALHDPVYFAAHLLGINPHPGQIRWLRNSIARENLLVTGNRWGKSVVSAIKVLHRALFQIRNPEFDRTGHYRVITASITQDQAGIIFNELVRLARQSVYIEPLIKEIGRTPFPHLIFGNGSLIEARSTQNRGEYLLGNDYDYFIFDEVAFETHADYVVEEVIQMRLVDREGMLDLVSTPNGKNWFYRKSRELSENPAQGYTQEGDSRENRHISRKFLEQRIELFSEDRVAQNIMGQFVDSGQEIIPGAYIDQALYQTERVSSKAPENKTLHYITGWDLARKRTATVGITLAVDSKGVTEVIALERFKHAEWNFVFEKIRRRNKRYPGRVVIDATGLGDVVVEELRDIAPIPFIFTEKSKAALLANLEMFHARGALAYDRWEIRQPNNTVWALEDELREARWDNSADFDAVMALALALWPLKSAERTPIVSARIKTL